MSEMKKWKLTNEAIFYRCLLIFGSILTSLNTFLYLSGRVSITQERFELHLFTNIVSVVLVLFLLVYKVRTTDQGILISYGMYERFIEWSEISLFEVGLLRTTGKTVVFFNGSIIKEKEEFEKYINQKVKSPAQTDSCFNCGVEIDTEEKQCSKCGWTWENKI